MSSQRRLFFKPVALLLVFAVLQVYVLVNPVKANEINTAPSMVFGQLLLSGNQSALINGASATSGTTIFSGAQLQTLDGVAATVQLGKLGVLTVDPNTMLSLTFAKDVVDVNVTQGNAVLTTKAGVTGTLTTPDGNKAMTTNANSTLGTKKAARRASGDHVLGFVLTAVLITVAVIVLVSDDDDDNTSPSL